MPFAAVFGLTAWCLGSTIAGEPAPHRKLPGLSKGQADARWIAPYVLAMKYSIAQKDVTTVRWFDESGRVIKELTGSGLHASPEFISQDEIVHDVQGKWKLAVPSKPGWGAGYLKGDRFVHEFHPVEGEIALDIYMKGKLIESAGPFMSFKGRGVELADDGSLALMTWKTSEKQAAQVVVIGPDGRLTFRADCGEDMYHPYPVASGRGVLVRVAGEPPVRFRYSSGGGPWVPHEIGPNAHPVLSLPNEEKVLFSTGIAGAAERFKLIDCGSGKVLWDTSPVEGFAGTAAAAIVFKGKIFLMGRDLAAVDIKTGNIIARWQPNVSRPDRGWFARRGNRLFIVSADEFVELNVADVVAKMNGWH